MTGPRVLPIVLLYTSLIQLTYAGVTRKYYVAAQEMEWDYSGGNDQIKSKFLKTDTDRIGSTYKKAVYVEYTDGSFRTEKQKPSSLGLVGPVLRAEVGDMLEIVFFNNATKDYSMHPHGVMYDKASEAAIYVDGTSGRHKADDVVAPGDKVTLTWHVTDAPGPRDPNCLPWVYHSHVNTPEDTSAGLIGVIVTCRPGTLDENGERLDVAVDYPLLVKIWDENLSWYLEDNTARCGDPDTCLELVEDDDFIESNYMAAINGYMYGLLPGLQVCAGEKAAFYVIGMGNEFDVHSLHFHGQSLTYRTKRSDTISVYSATFIAAEMTPMEVGHWLISDMVGENKKNGMGALLHVKDCGLVNETKEKRAVSSRPVREYFLSVESVLWNYGPGGKDGRTGTSLLQPDSDSVNFFEKSKDRIGGVYMKARFVGYTNSSFTAEIARSGHDLYLGMLGHVIQAEAGDEVKVTVRNNIKNYVSFLPHGMIYKESEESNKGGGRIRPGRKHTYTFQVPDDLFSGREDDCMVYLYMSDYNSERDPNSGLVGPLQVCRKGYFLKQSAGHKDRFLLLQTTDENKSLFISPNSKQVKRKDEGFVQSNLMSNINGFSFGTLPEMEFCLDDDVTWYVMTLGATEDVHTASFHGNTFTAQGRHRDTEPLVPGSTAALWMEMNNPGRWMVESHSNLARLHGMYGFYKVNHCGKTTETEEKSGKTREVFIAAQEVDWDYAPRERSILTGRDLNDPRDNANIFFRDDEDFIGDVYKKAIFKGYTDSSFSTPSPIDPEEQHTGILGPVIRAEVGDVISVTFKNMATRPYSIHAHGVEVSESDSGNNYHTNQAVPPGLMKQYTWRLPASSGPGPNDPNCVPWIYYSGVDPVKDMYSGLMGLVIVCRPGTLDASGRRQDVDREFLLLMSVMNEMDSWYLGDNIRDRAPNRQGTDFASDGDFEESNIMHAINGRLSGNTDHLDMVVNDTVAWYFASIGREVDLHSFHLHGHTVLRHSIGHRSDVINLFPGQAEAVEMVADVPGTWLLHCHQLDHIVAGMQAIYTVRETDSDEGKQIGGSEQDKNTKKGDKSGTSSTHQTLADIVPFPSVHRPPTNSGPIAVNFSMSLLDILSVKKNRQELQLLLTYTLQWSAPGLAWETNPSSGNVEQMRVPSDKLWTPDVVPMSLSQPLKPLFSTDVLVSSSGQVVWERSVSMSVLCDLTMVSSGNGVECHLKFASWTQGSDSVSIRPTFEYVDLSNYFLNSKYDVTHTNVTVDDAERSGSRPGSGSFSSVDVEIQFHGDNGKKKL